MSIQSQLYLYYSFVDILPFLYTFLVFLFNKQRGPTFGSLILTYATIYLDVILFFFYSVSFPFGFCEGRNIYVQTFKFSENIKSFCAYTLHVPRSNSQ